jgi:hypothetical protein
LSRLRPSDTRPLQPQLQAGQASTRDVLKCALKTVDPKDLLGTYLLVQYGYVMPFFGLELLDMARDVAAFNLPARVGQLFGVSL